MELSFKNKNYSYKINIFLNIKNSQNYFYITTNSCSSTLTQKTKHIPFKSSQNKPKNPDKKSQIPQTITKKNITKNNNNNNNKQLSHSIQWRPYFSNGNLLNFGIDLPLPSTHALQIMSDVMAINQQGQRLNRPLQIILIYIMSKWDSGQFSERISLCIQLRFKLNFFLKEEMENGKTQNMKNVNKLFFFVSHFFMRGKCYLIRFVL